MLHESSEMKQFSEKLDRLTKHVVQIEAINIYLLITGCVLFISSSIEILGHVRWLLACAFLAGTAGVVQVTNPPSSLRNRFSWAATLGGLFGAIGGSTGALVDLAALGLTGGAVTAGGFAVGAATGAALGDQIENWRNEKAFVERGEAFDFLYNHRNKNPNLANPDLINKALDRLPAFDKNADGRKWFEMEELKRVAKDKSPF